MKGKNFKSIVIAVLALCVIGSFSAVPVFAEELPEPVFSMNGHVRDLSEVGEGFEEAKEENISGIVFKNGGSALYEDFDSVKLDLSKPFSVSFFIKVNTSSLSCIFAKNDKVSGHAELYIDGNGTVCFYSPDVNSNNPVYWDLTGVTVNDGALHHVAMTYDGEVMKFYNNGILLNTWYSVSGPIANVACDMLSIGACNDGSLPLDGFIGDLRFYDTVLTDGQVALLDAEREEGDKDIVEVKDPVLLDTIIPDGMAVENGVAEGNLINDFSHNLGNTFTLSASFKTSCKEPFQVLFAKHVKTNGHFEVYLDNDVLAFYAPELKENTAALSGVTVNDGKEHAFAITYNGESISFWIDGVNVKSEPCTGSITSVTSRFSIGMLVDQSFPYTGKIGNIKLYNYVVDDATAKTLSTPSGILDKLPENPTNPDVPNTGTGDFGLDFALLAAAASIAAVLLKKKTLLKTRV